MAMPATNLAANYNPEILKPEVSLPVKKHLKLARIKANHKAIDLPIAKVKPVTQLPLTGSNRSQLLRQYSQASQLLALNATKSGVSHKSISLLPVPPKAIALKSSCKSISTQTSLSPRQGKRLEKKPSLIRPVHWLSGIGVSLLLILPYVLMTNA